MARAPGGGAEPSQCPACRTNHHLIKNKKINKKVREIGRKKGQEREERAKVCPARRIIVLKSKVTIMHIRLLLHILIALQLWQVFFEVFAAVVEEMLSVQKDLRGKGCAGGRKRRERMEKELYCSWK